MRLHPFFTVLGLSTSASVALAAPQTLNPDNGHYYEYVSATVTWAEARAAAEASSFMGVQGHLATIYDGAENAFVRSLDPSAVGGWLGGFQDTSASSYSEPSGGWRWVTGENFDYVNWRTSTGEPSDTGLSGENSLEMVGTGEWNDTDGSASSFNPGYVVEYDVPTLNAATGSYYLYVDARVTWTEARDAAASSSYRGVQGHLVTVTSQAENDFVRSLDPSAFGGWLGAFQDPAAPGYSEPANGWRWVTGEAFDYTDWRTSTGEPSDTGAGGENALEMVGTGEWNDSDGSPSSFNDGYVVEFPAANLNPANRHSYIVIDADLCWDEARAAAEAMVYQGIRGHLATITTASERDFVDSIVPAGANRWLGGFQDTAALDYAEPAGGWRWTTGEDFTFTDWAPGEPNAASGAGEDFLELFGSTSTAVGWNDSSNCTSFSDGYVVEFSDTFGDVYCSSLPNSTGQTGSITASGSLIPEENTLVLLASNLPPLQFGIFVTADGTGFSPLANGVLCIGGNIGRFQSLAQIQQADAAGNFALAVDTNAIPTPGALVSLVTGETRYFQAWFRDVGGAGANLTDAIAVTFL